MQYNDKLFKKLYTGDNIPFLGIGTFGSDKYNENQIAEAIYYAIKSGYRLIDCASVYQNEKEIGKVLKKVLEEQIVTRKDLFITSKVWNDMHDQVKEACFSSLQDLQIEYIDTYFVHWPFPNYHAPGCNGDARNENAKPFSIQKFMKTWRQCEQLVEEGYVKTLGMSNMSIAKLEAVLPLCKIQPAVLEMECHPSFQQRELLEYALEHKIQPIGYSPIGSPSRPERDRTDEDIVDMQIPEIINIAQKYKVHPATICLRWAMQKGIIPIPFSVKEYQIKDNLNLTKLIELTSEEMKAIQSVDKNCRLIKGQVFLWENATSWEALWDIDGTQDSWEVE